jgi:hypothetical protein
LPNNVYLFIDYRPLKRITYNFTRDETWINCSKVRYRYPNHITRLPKNFKNYLLHAHV